MSHLSLHSTQKHYDLIFSNTEEECETESSISSASEFEVDCDISLHAITFLRSTNAECALRLFFVDTMPLAFCQGEEISVHVNTPTNLLSTNANYSAREVEKLNNKPFLLHTDDFSATNSKAAVLDYMNSLLYNVINLFILWRTTLNFFDFNIFKNNLFDDAYPHTRLALSLDDLQLISAYTYAASYTRIRFLKTLANYIPETDTPTITFSKSYTPLSAAKEKELIEKSSVLKPISVRDAEIAGFSTKPLIDFSLFHDVDLSKPSAKRNSLDQKINTYYVKILKIMQFDLSNLTPDDIDLLKDFQQSHLSLINQAKSIRMLLTLEYTRLSQHPTRSLFQPDFLTLTLNAGRVSFAINNKILPDDETTAKIVFPPAVSYTLGTRNRQETVTVGDISHAMDTDNTRPRFTSSSVTTRGDRLYTPVKNSPGLIHVCTDLLSSSSIFKSLPEKSKYPHFNILHTEKISEETLATQSIYKCPTDLTYHRILRSFNQLNRVKILLLDTYFEKVFFPCKSQVFGSIRFQSTSIDD